MVLLCAESPRKKRSKTRGRISGGIPAPVLAMVNSAKSFDAMQTHRHAALRLVVFDGVVGQIQKQLAQAMPVAAHGNFLAICQCRL